MVVKPRYFRHFAICPIAYVSSVCGNKDNETNRKEEVDNIHDDQYQVSNSCLVVVVRGGYQANGHKVMAQHLPVVFSSLFDIDDNHLLNPESPLPEHVCLHEETHFALWPVGPELLHVEIVRRGHINILKRYY